MDYKNKYKKYKDKYYQLKQLQQIGSGKIIPGIDKRVLSLISTGETTQERIDRQQQEIEGEQINPPDGYRIMDSIDEIIECRQYYPDIQDIVRQNLDSLFANIFSFSNENGEIIPSHTLLIDARGDGNCFLNSLFIGLILSRKSDMIYDLYSITGVRESELVNFDHFKSSMYFLSKTYLEANLSNFPQDLLDEQIAAFQDPNRPDVHLYGKTYTDQFNSRILIIKVNDRFLFESVMELIPETINGETDYVIIIQIGEAHYDILIPLNSDLDLRRIIYVNMFDNATSIILTRRNDIIDQSP